MPKDKDQQASVKVSYDFLQTFIGIYKKPVLSAANKRLVIVTRYYPYLCMVSKFSI